MFFHPSDNIAPPVSKEYECDQAMLTFHEDGNQHLNSLIIVLFFNISKEKVKMLKLFEMLSTVKQRSRSGRVVTPPRGYFQTQNEVLSGFKKENIFIGAFHQK